jgi:hypothetical protein
MPPGVDETSSAHSSRLASAKPQSFISYRIAPLLHGPLHNTQTGGRQIRIVSVLTNNNTCQLFQDFLSRHPKLIGFSRGCSVYK